MKVWFNRMRHRRERKQQDTKAVNAAIKEAYAPPKPKQVDAPYNPYPFLLVPDAPTDYHWKPESADNQEYGNFVRDSASTYSSSNDGSSGGCE